MHCEPSRNGEPDAIVPAQFSSGGLAAEKPMFCGDVLADRLSLIFILLLPGIVLALAWPPFWLLRNSFALQNRAAARALRIAPFAIAGASFVVLVMASAADPQFYVLLRHLSLAVIIALCQ